MTEVFDWSVAIFIDGADGVIAVRKHARDGRWGPWHLPGGKREPYELSPQETARREVREETGIQMETEAFKVLSRVPRSTYKYRKGVKKPYKHYYGLFFCTATPEHIDAVLLRSTDTREQVRLIPFDEYRRMRGFFGLHRQFITKHGLVPKPERLPSRR